MKTLIFDKFLGYNVGGAQLSLHAIIGAIQGEKKLLGCEVKKMFNADKLMVNSLTVQRFKITEFPFLPYLDYWLNRNKIKKIIQQENADVLFTQGLWGAVAVQAFSRKSIFFVRDMYQLNVIPFYQVGIKKIYKKLYLLLQWPFVCRMFKDNEEAIKKASVVVANSEYIKKEIKRRFNREAMVIYPIIDLEPLLALNLPQEKCEYITSIGDTESKGIEVVRKLASQMPDHKFLVVGRNFNQEFIQGNITFRPWVADMLSVYRQSKILIIPTLVDEAFGRTAVEAMALGIPVIAARRGGLPEIVDNNMLVDDVWNMVDWKDKVIAVEKHYNNLSTKVRGGVVRFDAKVQLEKIKNLLN